MFVLQQIVCHYTCFPAVVTVPDKGEGMSLQVGRCLGSVLTSHRPCSHQLYPDSLFPQAGPSF